MSLRKAKLNELDRIRAFYRYVAENTENMETYGRWIYGLYPTDDRLKDCVNNGCIYYIEEWGKIVGACAVTFRQEDAYRPVPWELKLEDNEVAIVHLLCTDPKLQKKGMARKLMAEVVELAREKRRKAIRLEALCCNTPAHKLYESLGFRKCGELNWDAPNTGPIDFYFFEMAI